MKKLYRLFKFWWNDGPKRLKSAKLRRQGDVIEALNVLYIYGVVFIVCVGIQMFPLDYVQRHKFYRYYCYNYNKKNKK